MKRLGKMIKINLVLTICLMCIFLQILKCYAGETSENTEIQNAIIGISVYDIEDSEVQAFREYFEQYLGTSFDVEFLYSDNISTAEDEGKFIKELNEKNIHGIISFVSSFAETSVPLCDALGMYYISGSGTIKEDIFDKLKNYPYFLGTTRLSVLTP